MYKKKEERMRVAPKANDLTDGFEDIDQLLLRGAQDTRDGQQVKRLSSPML